MEQDLEQKMVSGAKIGGELGLYAGGFTGMGIGTILADGHDKLTQGASVVVGALLGMAPGIYVGALTGAAVAAGTYYAVKAYRSLTER